MGKGLGIFRRVQRTVAAIVIFSLTFSTCGAGLFDGVSYALSAAQRLMQGRPGPFTERPGPSFGATTPDANR